MSRQMAFQLTYPQLLEKWGVLIGNPKPNERQKTVGDWIDSLTKDEREQAMLLAAYATMHRCVEEKRDIKDIQKVIAWRCEDGKNLEFQVEFKRRVR